MLIDENGNQVLDFLGGYGSTLVGHSYPPLVQKMKALLDSEIPVHAQASIRPYATELSVLINQSLAQHHFTHLANTGTEAVEAAIKHQLMIFQSRLKRARYQGKTVKGAPVLFALKGSFHGKSAGSVHASWNEDFRTMYPQGSFDVVFLDPDHLVKARQQLESSFENGFARAIGILFEPIQCEGGIKALNPELVKLFKEFQTRGIPLIADEIQSGFFRTGTLLASEKLGLKPNLFLLGKSLGGSLVKISAVCIDESIYEEEFSIVHTSTFAEDDLSSAISVETLNLIRGLHPTIAERAQEFEKWISSASQKLSRFKPFLKEVRCYGFLVGIEFDFDHQPSIIPHFLKTTYDAGFGSYLMMSALLNQHGVRIGVTLSQPNTLRLEPSLWTTAEEVQRVFEAIENLLELLTAGKLLAATRHLWRDTFDEKALNSLSPIHKASTITDLKNTRTVAFATHLIDDRHLLLLDPMFIKLSREERSRFLRKFGEVAGPCHYHDQIIEGVNGRKVRVCSLGSFRTTPFYEKSIREQDVKGNDAVLEMVDFAKELGADLLGLGQYTSIVTRSGTTLTESGIAITSGNALTAGFAIQALDQLLTAKNKTLSSTKIGIVGALGNIGGAMAAVLLDRGAELVLIVRDEKQIPELKSRFSADLHSSKISFSHQLNDLVHCEAVIAATNTADPILFSEHFQHGAVLVDVSVPTVVDESVIRQRKDLSTCHGGMATLPLNQTLETEWMPLPRGQIYACLAETIVLALSGHQGSYSVGNITKENVYDILDRAKTVGIELGTLLPLQSR